MIALDLFAGAGGWSVACKRLGVDEYGVENMPEAIATREANGMRTLFHDIWDGLSETQWETFTAWMKDGGTVGEFYEMLIASPPCQTFSMAGKGAGRKALDEVLQAIAERDYLDPAKLHAFGERHDPKTALVLSPLAYIARDLPRIVVLEQVPTVLPVWKAYADVMRRWGYSVVTQVLNAEQYGVPQTRKRAILIARWDAEARMPEPTHAAYNPRAVAGGRYVEGLKPWVSMAEALRWGMTERPGVSVAPGAEGGGPDTFAAGGSGARATIHRERDAGRWVITGGATSERYKPRSIEHPATPVTGANNMYTGKGEPFTRYPDGSKTMNRWAEERPATTVAGDARIWPPGHKVNADDARRLGDDAARERYGDRAGRGAERVSVADAATLQSFPEGFVFSGTLTKQFLQVGNAVPPLLAEAVLRAAIGD